MSSYAAPAAVCIKKHAKVFACFLFPLQNCPLLSSFLASSSRCWNDCGTVGVGTTLSLPSIKLQNHSGQRTFRLASMATSFVHFSKKKKMLSFRKVISARWVLVSANRVLTVICLTDPLKRTFIYLFAWCSLMIAWRKQLMLVSLGKFWLYLNFLN